MKLGSFWGLTAPMLMLAKDKLTKDVYQKYMSVLNVAGNTVFLIDVQKELKYLYDYIVNFPYTYSTNDTDFYNLVGVTIKNGIAGDGDLVYLLEDKIYCGIGVKICTELQKGNARYSRSLLQYPVNTEKILRTEIKNYMQENEIDCDRLNGPIQKILRKYKSESTEDCLQATEIQHVAELFNLELTVPDRIMRNGVEIELKELDKKYLLYLKKNLQYLEGCICSIQISGVADIPIFDTTFQTFIHRKPACLYYIMVKKFDYLKTNNVSMLNTILKESRSSLQRLKDAVSKFVVVDTNTEDVLTQEQFDDIVSSFDTSKAEFFKKLVSDSYIYISDFILDDLNLLSDLYDILIDFDLVYFADVLGVSSFSEEEFDAFNARMQAIGLFGLNRYSFNLFREFIKSVVLVTTDKISKTEEQISELELVLNNVQAFLDSIQPIGGEIVV